MKTIFFLCGMILATLHTAVAQNAFTISGRLADEASGEPVPFANVALYTLEGSLVSGVASDMDGLFTLQQVAAGTYNIEIQFIGYEKKVLEAVEVSGQLDLGAISMQESSTVLNEVVVEAQEIKKPVEITAEGMTINPGQNLSNLGGSALDVLRNTPSVNVDIDGGISIRGSKSANILINGRNSTMAVNLDQIPASAIKSIKIINNPGAKYDADAQGGIINIELKKGEDLGTHGNAELSVGTGGRYNGSIKIGHQSTAFNVYGGYDIRRSVSRSDFYRYRENFGDQPETITQSGNVIREGMNHNFKYGADYYFGKNILSYEGLAGLGGDDDVENRLNVISPENGTPRLNDRVNNELEDGHSFDNAIIYERTFDNEEQTFKARVSHSTRANEEIQSINSTDQTELGENFFQQRGTTDASRSFTVLQADYVHPINASAKLETGVKTLLRSIDNNYVFETFDEEQNEWSADPDISNNFLYDEQVHAFYGTYAYTGEKISFAVGNRFELASLNTELVTTGEKNDQSYFNLFPSANVQYKLNEKQDLRFTYSRRIDRPSSWSLNPFPDIADSLNIRSGNPNLQPEYIQSLELGQHIMLPAVDFTTTAFYRYTTGIRDYIVTVEDGISYGRPENLNNGSNLGLEFLLVSDLSSWWSINASYTIFQNRIDGSNINADFTNESLAWNSKIVSDFSLPNELKLQLTGNYQSAVADAQGENISRYHVNASVMKSFFEGKGKVGLSVRDVFNTLTYGGTSFGDGFRQEREYKPETRLLYLNVGFQI